MPPISTEVQQTSALIPSSPYADRAGDEDSPGLSLTHGEVSQTVVATEIAPYLVHILIAVTSGPVHIKHKEVFMQREPWQMFQMPAGRMQLWKCFLRSNIRILSLSLETALLKIAAHSGVLFSNNKMHNFLSALMDFCIYMIYV